MGDRKKYKKPAIDFPVKVTRWLRARDDIQFVVNDFIRQGVAFVVRKKTTDQTYSIWRESFGPEDEELLMEDAIARKALVGVVEVERHAPHSVEWSSKGIPEGFA